MNAYIDTDGTYPQGLTEADKILRILNFWKRWSPEFRQCIIKMHIEKSDMFCHADGVIEGVLKGLEQIDLVGLHNELEKAGLLKNSTEEADGTGQGSEAQDQEY